MVATHRRGFDPCLAHLMMLSNEKWVSEAYLKKCQARRLLLSQGAQQRLGPNGRGAIIAPSCVIFSGERGHVDISDVAVQTSQQP
jgi:hypothetical protein